MAKYKRKPGPKKKRGRRAKLTDQQIVALDYYFENGFNKKKALISAGYAATTAANRPGKIFDNPLVVNEIEKRKRRLAKKHELSQDWIIQRFMKLADAGNMLAKFKKVQPDGTLNWDFTGATEEDLALVTELGVDTYMEGRGENAVMVKKFRVKHPDQHAALVALSRHLGLFKDSLELKGSLADKIREGRERLFGKKDEEDTEDKPTVH